MYVLYFVFAFNKVWFDFDLKSFPIDEDIWSDVDIARLIIPTFLHTILLIEYWQSSIIRNNP